MINERIGPREDYANLQITITAANGTRRKTGSAKYNVFFEIAHWRFFDPCKLSLNLPKLLELKADPQAYGQALGKAFFSNKSLGVNYGESLAAVQGRGDGLRVRLVIEPPELQELPWERIYQHIDGEWRPLGSTAATPFSRFIPPRGWKRPVPVMDRPLRMLVVIASPTDLDQYSLDSIDSEECQWLHQALGAIPELSVTYLESGSANRPSLNEIRRRLPEGYQMIHFLCHGAHKDQGTALFLEDDDGKVDPVEQDCLVEVFSALKAPPALCFLAACESARRDRHDAMLPLGPELVRTGGVQAAVAMTDQVGLRVAQTFASQFYVRLLKHGVVDLAVNEARALVQDDWDWGVPVLFSRLEDNQLLDFPIARIGSDYAAHAGKVAGAIDEAVNNARVEEHGDRLLQDLQELLTELNKSNGLQVDITSRFRRTGRDPQDFEEKFSTFYYDFKDLYYKQTWTKETTSCGRVGELKSKVLPRLSPLLDPASFDQLSQELDLLSNADTELVKTFRDYLNAMNTVIEGIWTKIEAGDIPGAIQIKREFEIQIDPSFKRTQALFDRMSQHYETARAA